MSCLLALETSTKFLSVALFQNQSLLEEINKPPDGRSHSEMLLPLIDSLLQKFYVTLSSETRIAFVAGPGSYTSLRVGLATVLGLARGSGCLLTTVSSLQALAWQKKNQDYLVAPLLQAGRGKVYGALYDKFIPVIKEGAYKPEEFLLQLPPNQKKIEFMGPGSPLFETLIRVKNLSHISIDATVHPKASSVGFLCLEKNLPVENFRSIKLDYFQEPDFGFSQCSFNVFPSSRIVSR